MSGEQFMRGRRNILISVYAIAIAGAFGCGRSPEQAPTTAPATQPVAVVVVPQPEPAALQVDQATVSFPAAILRLSISKGHINARLSSDDPPEAIQDNYHGNSFDLIMALNISDTSEIDHAVWEFAPTATLPTRESGYGIFLDGQRRRLHPQDVVASFSREGDRVVVDMKGVFFEYESAETGRPVNPPPRVLVQGRLVATVENK
jgi:hypothetical protein